MSQDQTAGRATIVAAYERGDPVVSIAATTGLSCATIYRTLHCAEAKVRPNGSARTYALNEAAFDVPITEEKAYWVGFLMADGCITRCHNTLYVNVTAGEKDGAHVVKFRDFLGSNQPVYIKADKRKPRWTPTHNLNVASSRLATALISFGVTPRKSYTAQAIGLGGDRHFWRGVADGDGCISLVKKGKGHIPFFGICGSGPLMGQFAAFIGQSLARDVKPRPTRSIFEVRLNGRFALQAMHILYDNCSVALDRKLALARSLYARAEERAALGDHRSLVRPNSTLLTHDGLTLTAAQWSARTGLPCNTLYHRLYLGWSIERALTTPVRSPARSSPA